MKSLEVLSDHSLMYGANQ